MKSNSMARKTKGNLTIYENEGNGFSWEWRYHDALYGERNAYGGVSFEDLFAYNYEELLPEKFDCFSKEEQDFFLKEYCRIKGKLRG